MSQILKFLKTAAFGQQEAPLPGANPAGDPGGQPGDGAIDRPSPGGPPDAAAAGPDDAGDQGGGAGDEQVALIHSAGGSAVVLTPDQIQEMHSILTQGGAEPHGLMIILPKEGTGREVHFEPIPASALATPHQAEALLDAWEQAHSEGGGSDDADGTVDDDSAMPDPSADPMAGPDAGMDPAKDPMAGTDPASANPGVPANPAGPAVKGLRSLAKPTGASDHGNPDFPGMKAAGFMAAFLHDHKPAMEKKANTSTIHGTGRGMGAAIDALLKGAGQYSLREMMNAVADIDRLDDPETARAIARGSL